MVGFCPEHIQRDTKEEGSLFSWHSGWRAGDTNKGWKIRDAFETHKHFIQGFSGGSVVKNPPANAEDRGLVRGSGSSPEVGWQLTPVFLLGEFHKQRWLAGYSPVQFSCSVVSDSLRPHESQHTRPPCPSPTSGVHLNSRPLSQWHLPAISSSVVQISSCHQPRLASESFPVS